MTKGTYVYCTTQFEGFHQWLNAPQEVGYLREIHRHIFHVKVIVPVTHDNRQVEFITLKHDVDKIIKECKDNGYWTSEMSCEMLADSIKCHLLNTKYKYREVHSVEVSEDGENGAIVVC